MLSVKYVFLIWQETNGGIVILKTVLKSDLWPGSEKCGFNPKLEDNDLKSGCYRVPKLPPLSVNYVCPISHETNHPIMIPKIVLKSDVWPGSEKCGFNPKFEDNDLKSGCYRISKLPPLSVNYVCPISHETNHPIMILKIVLKSVLWRGSESAWYFCIFQLLCFSLHPNIYMLTLILHEERPNRQIWNLSTLGHRKRK